MVALGHLKRNKNKHIHLIEYVLCWRENCMNNLFYINFMKLKHAVPFKGDLDIMITY